MQKKEWRLANSFPSWSLVPLVVDWVPHFSRVLCARSGAFDLAQKEYEAEITVEERRFSTAQNAQRIGL